MEYQYIEKRYNTISLNSINAFANIRGGVNHDCKDVYFLRVLGVNGTYKKDIADMDEILTQKAMHGQAVYHRFLTFPQLAEAQDIQVYSQCFDNWIQSGRTILFTQNLRGDNELGELIGTAFRKVLEPYHTNHPNVSTSMEKNFVVKLLFWLDKMGYDYIKSQMGSQSMKCAIHNVAKEQEYYFCYLLTLLGVDVLLLQSRGDIDEKAQKLGISQELVIGGFHDVELPEYNSSRYMDNNREYNSNSQDVKKVVVKIPRHQGHDAHAAQKRQAAAQSAWSSQGTVPMQGSRGIVVQSPPAVSAAELPFEELAQRASSIVMIAIHDKTGEVIGSGSGIMVGRAGYILTNNHVTCGAHYSVRIEDDDTVYKTDELIKYNSFLDLAVIRIDRQLTPLPIYQGRKSLVRGQKVVAIGSPLGFFNTVSDGIVSGFRRINNVDMIQFTAPISNGSSGGAVLNMQGEVVGIATLGFDEGQNINLAVGYEFINGFVKGFQ